MASATRPGASGGYSDIIGMRRDNAIVKKISPILIFPEGANWNHSLPRNDAVFTSDQPQYIFPMHFVGFAPALISVLIFIFPPIVLIVALQKRLLLP